MFDDILGDNKEAEERKIRRHLQDMIDIYDYSSISHDNVLSIWSAVYKWMVDVYGGDWEEDYEVTLDWDKHKSKFFIDVEKLY
jgi:hypothetical protein